MKKGENTMKKRLLSILLAAALLIGLVPTLLLPAAAAGYTSGDFTYKLNDDGSAIITRYSGSAAALTIPSSLDGHTVKQIGSYAFGKNTTLTSVSIPETVTELEYSAFMDCTSLTAVTIPSGLTKAGSLGNSAFSGCSALTTVQFGSGLASIPEALFEGTGLKTVTLPESVTSIGSWAFANCAKLEQVHFPANLTSIGLSAFENCTALTAVTLPKRLTELGGAVFENCSALKSVWIPKSLTNNGFGDGFKGCTALTDITFETGITKIADYQFDGSPIKSITIPGTVTTVGMSAFSDCANLTAIDLPSSVTEIDGYAFENCTALTAVTLPKHLRRLGTEAFLGCTALKSVFIPLSLQNASNPFQKCTALTDVTFEDGRTELPDTLLQGSGVRQLTVPQTVTKIGYSAFASCTQLTAITLPAGLRELGNEAFKGCTALTGVALPDSLTDLGYGVFRDCSALTAAEFPAGIDPVSWSSGSSMLRNCTSLRSVKLPKTVSSLGNYFFAGCTALERIVLPDSVTEIGSNLFNGCTALADVTLSTNLQAIPENTFYGCVSLQKLVAPYAVTKIGKTAFANCTSLTELTLLRNVTEAAADALSYPEQVTVYGVKGTYAETYAASVGARFAAIDRPATAVSLPKSVTVKVWSSVRLLPSLDPVDCTDELVWSSSDASVAAVSADGTVTGRKDGSAVITVTAGSVSARCEVAVGTPAHVHSYTAVVTAPTCAVQGYTTYTCSCGEYYYDDYFPALGHSYVDGVCTRCGASRPETRFVDIKFGSWYYNSIVYAVSNGLMNGVGDSKFEPEEGMTRAMLVTVLWRYEGSPKQRPSTFSDVRRGQWYSEAVSWAAKNGIVTGVGDNKFEPDTQITREQIATILYRYAQKKRADTSARGSLSAFPDNGKVNGWAKTALQWCVGEGLIGGTNENGRVYLDPQGTATRAQVATILMRYIEKLG